MRVYRLPKFEGIDDLTMAEAETPRPQRGQALVRLRAASLNYRDLLIVTGRYTRGAVRPGLVPLSDGAGEVVEVGPDVTRVQKGDRAASARVIATSSSDEKLERVRALGASDLINYRRSPEWDREALRLTGGRGVDHVVEVGGAGTLPRSLRAVRRGGYVNVIGLLAGGGEIDPMVVLGRSIVMRGIFVGSREMFEAMNRAITAQGLRPVIDRVYPFKQAAEAYRHLQSGAHFGKVVIRIA